MESAPLTLAYSHSRNATNEIHKANPIAASEEHDLAAGEFANAARSTGDPEALRTLKLLEQHHQRLAELLKYRPTRPATVEDAPEHESGGQGGALSTVMEEDGESGVGNQTGASSRNAGRLSLLSPESRQHRDLSSSIASNLASARGIQPKSSRRGLPSPTSPTVTSQNADGRMATGPEDWSSSKPLSRGYDRRSQGSHSQISPYKSSPSVGQSSQGTASRSAVAHIPPSILQPGTDDAFARFYSTVESLGTRLSAALAFTGLPLSNTAVEEPAAVSEQPEKVKPSLPKDKSRTTPSGSPDVSRFFSKAALKAVREDGGGPGVAESFYVVPTSGGTVSYAGMLQGQRQSSALSEIAADDEFVDASEMPVHGNFEGEGQGAGKKERNRAGSLRTRSLLAGSRDGLKDDVRRERDHWKAVAEDTGRRLRAFEMNAQRESIMAASIYRGGGGTRSRHHSPESVRGHASTAAVPNVPQIPAEFKRASTTTTSEASDGVKDQKIRELEDELSQTNDELKKVQKENRKLMAVVEKYRKRFEDLKENARERMRMQEEKERLQQAKENESARQDQMMG